MLQKIKTKIFPYAPRIALFFVLGLSVFWGGSAAQSAATSTLRGAALWTDGHGYVYFNCLDDQIGDLMDVAGNFYSTSATPYGFHFSSAPCVNLIHRVYIDANNNFSGLAWSPIYGLISFAATTTPDNSFRTHCPSCLAGACSACYSPSDQNVYGYAQVVGNGMYINLNQTATTSVRLQNYDLTNQIVPGNSNILAGDFAYDADNNFTGSSSPSFLSFNCQTENGGAPNCTAQNENYKVYIANLQIGDLSAPNWNYAQACQSGALRVILKWDLKSGQYPSGNPPTYYPNQTAFEIVVNNTNSLSTTTNVCYSGVVSSAANQYIFNQANCPNLNYNQNYYWWIRLYDDQGTPTAWYQFGATGNGAASFVTDGGDPDSNPLTFTTYKHEFPSPFFTWAPNPALVGTSTYFTSQSDYYTGGFASLQPCDNFHCSYLWSMSPVLFGDTINNSSSASTTMIFGHPTGTSVFLQVTDKDSYVCSTSTTLDVNYALPMWREVKAQ